MPFLSIILIVVNTVLFRLYSLLFLVTTLTIHESHPKANRSYVLVYFLVSPLPLLSQVETRQHAAFPIEFHVSGSLIVFIEGE